MISFCFLLFIIFSILYAAQNTKIDTKGIIKIGYGIVTQTHVTTDKIFISKMSGFLNSFWLIKRYPDIDCERPTTIIILYRKNGSSETIFYNYTSIVYRNIRYQIDKNKSYKLDVLLWNYSHVS